MNRIAAVVVGICVAGCLALPAWSVTIDTMDMGDSTLTHGHSPTSRWPLLEDASIYHLSDGSSWHSGAGILASYSAGAVQSVSIDGDTISYQLPVPVGTTLWDRIDYGAGGVDRSAVGKLVSVAPPGHPGEDGIDHGNTLRVCASGVK